MITELEVDSFEMKEYDLIEIGIDGKLIFEKDKTYIDAEKDIFPIYSSGSFSKSNDIYILSNGEIDDYACLTITEDQYLVIKELLSLHN